MNIAQAIAIRGEQDSYERQENLWLLAHILNVDALNLKMMLEQELLPQQQRQYVNGLQRIQQGEPLAYVVGTQPFWTLDLKVTADTLVPRPDTEILVETALALDLPDDAYVVDLGTGSGAIALALASERSKWSIIATDIYTPTLAVAKENAEKHGLFQVKFLCGSWFEALTPQKFHLIVSNPPYIDPTDVHMQTLTSEPRRALVAEQNGLADIKSIISQSLCWLVKGGWVVLEHGYDQGESVRQLFQQHQFSQIKTVQDYGGNDRVTLACFNL